MDELDLVRRIRRWTGAPHVPGLTLGIGDDCALYRPAGSPDHLLFTTDMMLEGVHFLPGVHSPRDIGWKALARGLSDIAAMGGDPLFCLVSLALAPWALSEDQSWLRGFYAGLGALARKHRINVAGGDLAQTGSMSIDVVVCGRVPKGAALRRDAAKAGHLVYVSGSLGGAALGLSTRKGAAWRKHLRPEPRIALGKWLREKLRATSCIDLSDGLSLDCKRLAEASGLAAILDRTPPAFRGASQQHAWHGGDDYELLFTVAPGTPVPSGFGKIPLTRLGRMERGVPGRVAFRGQDLAPGGFDHFR